MNKRDFKRTEELLRNAGLPVTEAAYDANAFGSWRVTLGTPTPLRIVWDGRDQCLFVYAEVGASAFSQSEWQQVWAAYSAPEQTPEHVVGEVVALAARDLKAEAEANRAQVGKFFKDEG